MWDFLLIWEGLKDFFGYDNPESDEQTYLDYTVVITNATNVFVSRLGTKIDLVMVMSGEVEGTGQIAEVKITVSDPETLRELSNILLNLVPKLEPPYYGEDDIGPLWDDERPDIYQDVKYTIGEELADEWLNSPNMHFGLKTPAEIIRSGKAYWVRTVLRSIRTGTFT